MGVSDINTVESLLILHNWDTVLRFFLCDLWETGTLMEISMCNECDHLENTKSNVWRILELLNVVNLHQQVKNFGMREKKKKDMVQCF